MTWFLYVHICNTEKMAHCSKIFANAIALKFSNSYLQINNNLCPTHTEHYNFSNINKKPKTFSELFTRPSQINTDH